MVPSVMTVRFSASLHAVHAASSGRPLAVFSFITHLLRVSPGKNYRFARPAVIAHPSIHCRRAWERLRSGIALARRQGVDARRSPGDLPGRSSRRTPGLSTTRRWAAGNTRRASFRASTRHSLTYLPGDRAGALDDLHKVSSATSVSPEARRAPICAARRRSAAG